MTARHATLESVIKAWEHPRLPEGWKMEAACRFEDKDMWFPNDREVRHKYNATRVKLTEVTRNICNNCPVKKECLDFAINIDMRYGMYGGLTQEERRKLTGKKPI